MTTTREFTTLMRYLESTISLVDRTTPDLVDQEVVAALEALCTHYAAEYQGQASPLGALPPRARSLADNLLQMIEWRLGRAPLPEGDTATAARLTDTSLSVEDALRALAQMTTAACKWNRGRDPRGYLEFLKAFAA
jgi:hypothetical protein